MAEDIEEALSGLTAEVRATVLRVLCTLKSGSAEATVVLALASMCSTFISISVETYLRSLRRMNQDRPRGDYGPRSAEWIGARAEAVPTIRKK
jgi:hypothetical protein